MNEHVSSNELIKILNSRVPSKVVVLLEGGVDGCPLLVADSDHNLVPLIASNRGDVTQPVTHQLEHAEYSTRKFTVLSKKDVTNLVKGLQKCKPQYNPLA